MDEINKDAILAVYAGHLKRTNRLIEQNAQLVRTYQELRQAHVKASVELEELRAERLRIIADINREFPDLTDSEISALN